MREKVGIVAVAQTTYEAAHDRWRSHELTSQTVEKVLAETGLAWAKDGTGIDATVTCNNWLMEGRAIANVPHGDVAGSHLRTEVKVSTEGINAVAFAVIQILSGHHDVILVTSCCKESNTNQSVVDNFCFEPVFHQKLGLDFLQAAALGQTRYMHRYGISREQCAGVVAKNRRNGLSNPDVRFGANTSVEDVMKAPFLAYPISSQEARPACDGACTLILATEHKARKLTDKPVWTEGIGLADPGQGGRLLDSGATRIDGKSPVNPSGGVLSGNPRMTAGMVRVIESALQLRGEAGPRQLEKPRRALAHGSNGPCGQEHCVLILEKGF